jgi:ferredoxin
METVFIGKLKPMLDALAKQMLVYTPRKSQEHYFFKKYDPQSDQEITFNDIRICTPVKEFLFPVREMAASYSPSSNGELTTEIEPFAIFGLKDCDLRSIEILDKVFMDEDFIDALYVARREKMFIISTDCNTPGESCFCNMFDGVGYSTKGFDLNASMIKDGFIIEAGSTKGKNFIDQNSDLFADVPDALINQRKENRDKTQKLLEENNKDFEFGKATKEIVENYEDSEIYDEHAKKCVECQACTRVCPTCHCFYLYDNKQKDYFTKMKIWDSCMRYSYAAVAGGANPNQVLGDRLKHRLMHKFVYFLDRYGIEMCVGCGRCVDAEVGTMDLRQVLKRLSEQITK